MADLNFICANPSCYCVGLRERDMFFMTDTNIEQVQRFNRKFGGIICVTCADAYPYIGSDKPLEANERVCDECEGGPAGVRILNETTGRYETDWCPRCNGHRVVKV